MEGGAWGLVVVASAFFIQVFVFGVSESIGVYNIEFLDYFNDDTVGVSLIASINLAVFFCSGPLTSYVMRKLTYRKVTLIGSLLVVLGILLARFLLYIPALCVCLGVITGLGSGMVYVPSFVLCGLYYERHRSLATGAASGGCGMGVAVGPIIVGYLIKGYGWRGSLIMLAGLNLHLFVCSALLRQPPTKTGYPAREKFSGGENSNLHQGVTGDTNPHQETTAGRKTHDKATSETQPHQNSTGDTNQHQKVTGDSDTHEKSTSDTNQPQNATGDTNQHPRVAGDTNQPQKATGDTDQHPRVTGDTNQHPRVTGDTNQPQKATGDTDQHPRVTGGTNQHQNATGETNQHYEATVAEGSNTHGDCNSDTDALECALSDRTSTTEKPGRNRRETATESTGIDLPETATAAKALRHIHILTDLGFVVYFLSNLLWNINTGMQTAFIADFATERGVERINAAWLVTISGFGLFFGGLLGALLGNVLQYHRMMLYVTACVIFGVISAAVPLGSEYDHFAGLLFCARMSFGVSLGLQVVVLADLIGAEALGDGMGYLMLSNGIGSFIGPYLAGYMRDITGNYDSGFYVGGAMAVAAGVIMVLIPLVRPVCYKEKKRSPET